MTPLALACASCHPEGDEDGHTWFFDEDPGRRTQTLRGHWRGDVADLQAVMHTTFTTPVAVHEGAEPLQVPMLRGVGHRAPYFHDGCAKELSETFDGTCSPGHVPTVELTDAEAAALATYLRSL